MRRSKTLEKLRSGRCARVCGMGHYLPFYIRYAAHFRFDVIWLDLEHRAMSQREVQSWGIAGGTPEQLSRYRQMGAQMLIAAGDFALVKVLEEGSKVLDETVE